MPRGISPYDEARLQGRLWTPPNSDPTLVEQWDATSSSNITLTSGNVSGWSGQVRSTAAVQSISSLQPSYSPTAMNGKPAIVLGGSQYLIASLTLAGSSVFVVIVGTLASSTNYGRILSLTSSSQDNDYDNAGSFVPLDANTGVSQIRAERNSAATANVSTAYGVPFVSSSYLDGARMYQSINGNTVSSVASTGSLNIQQAIFGIGRGYGNYTYGWVGQISQIYIYNAVPSTYQQNKVVSSMAWKWGTQKWLSASNPFANRPPLIGD